MTKVQDTFDEIRDQGLLADRREYTQEDLERMYGLTGQQTGDLYHLIQREFDTHIGDIAEVSPELLKEGIVEALHGGLDGWDDEHDRLTIERFVDDMTKYANLAAQEIDTQVRPIDPRVQIRPTNPRKYSIRVFEPKAIHHDSVNDSEKHDPRWNEERDNGQLAAAQPSLPAHAKLDRDEVVKAMLASGYDASDIRTVTFRRMSLNGLVAHYEVTYHGPHTGMVYIRAEDDTFKGEF